MGADEEDINKQDMTVRQSEKDEGVTGVNLFLR